MTKRNLSYGSRTEASETNAGKAYIRRVDTFWQEDPDGVSKTLPAFRGRLRDTYGLGFDALARVHSAAADAASWAATAMDTFITGLYDDDTGDAGEAEALDRYDWLMRGFAARSITTFAEVSWLIEGGFPHGAMARVRTLHELAILAIVFAEHGNPERSHPELVERFMRHREAFYRATAEQLAGDEAELEDPIDDDTLRQLTEQRDLLLEKYGSRFGEPYGWAQPLFSAKTRVSFSKLSNLVEPKLNILYSVSSSHIHADSVGWHHSRLVYRGAEVFTAGPTNLGLTLPATLACHFLKIVLDYVVPTSIEVDEETDTDGLFLLLGVQHFSDQSIQAMEEAEREVEVREESLNQAE